MADVFNWVPDDKPSGQFDFRIKQVQFGDGYRQIAKDGLNTRLQKWQLSFDRDEAEIGAIQSFLDAHEAQWFLWTPPGSNTVQGRYICLGYSKIPSLGINEKLSCTFEEFVAP